MTWDSDCITIDGGATYAWAGSSPPVVADSGPVWTWLGLTMRHLGLSSVDAGKALGISSDHVRVMIGHCWSPVGRVAPFTEEEAVFRLLQSLLPCPPLCRPNRRIARAWLRDRRIGRCPGHPRTRRPANTCTDTADRCS